jgi:hypothetical protein
LIEYLGETHTDIDPQSMVPLPTNTQLQSLSINGEGPVVAVFLSVVAASLQHLTLSLDFPSEKIFDQVSVLTTLVHLSLNWNQTTKPMTSDHFDALCALENLKYLCLGWRSEHRATLGWLTDDKLADWISHFAGLHTLQLTGRSAVSQRLLLSPFLAAALTSSPVTWDGSTIWMSGRV